MSNARDQKVRYAVVGAGNIAQVAVLPAFAHASENSELAAVVSNDPEKREQLAKRYGLEWTANYDEFERLLERGRIDAVYIALPNNLHREFTERAARLGVHVLCEKPMAPSVEDCEAMIRACAERGVRLMIAYRLHFEEANLRAIELVKSGQIGEPRLFTSVFAQEVRAGDIRTKDELAGGALYDMGIYCINAARYLFRAEPEEVCAITLSGDQRFHGVDATTNALLRFPGGRVAQLSASLNAAPVSTYRVVGTRGDLRVEPAYEYSTALTHHLTVGGETSTRTFPARDQFAPEIVEFSRCILEGAEPEPSGEEGLADVRVIRAILTSAAQERTVRLDPFSRSRRPDPRQQQYRPPVNAPDPIHA